MDGAGVVLRDAFDRIREQVIELTDGLTEAVGIYRPDAEANTVDWLLWHLIRVQDDHVAQLAGVSQVWPQWRDRFALPVGPTATGYGHSADEVGAVRADSRLLAGYHADVHQLTLDYLLGLSAAELDRVVDDRWDPPVTAAVRLVSVIGDALAHLGQAAYVRGLAERRSGAWSGADR